jgi:hypothetical protein
MIKKTCIPKAQLTQLTRKVKFMKGIQVKESIKRQVGGVGGGGGGAWKQPRDRKDSNKKLRNSPAKDIRSFEQAAF